MTLQDIASECMLNDEEQRIKKLFRFLPKKPHSIWKNGR